MSSGRVQKKSYSKDFLQQIRLGWEGVSNSWVHNSLVFNNKINCVVITWI